MTIGFGVQPEEDSHYFLVSLPKTGNAEVQISEHMSWPDGGWEYKIRATIGGSDERLRVILVREKWDVIADTLAEEFNRRLRKAGMKTGKWKAGLVPVCVSFGKELVLLAWAIEDADPAIIPGSISNWKGLSPEERWWLYTMTNAATGQAVRGRGTGWRKAVRFALINLPGRVLEHARRLIIRLTGGHPSFKEIIEARWRIAQLVPAGSG